MDLAHRLKQTRSNKGISQQQLALIAQVHYTNIGRYERGQARPSAEVLNKIAAALEVSPDYLMNGTLENKAQENILDKELLLQFQRIEKMPTNKKELLKEFLEAFIFKSELQQRLAQ